MNAVQAGQGIGTAHAQHEARGLGVVAVAGESEGDRQRRHQGPLSCCCQGLPLALSDRS